MVNLDELIAEIHKKYDASWILECDDGRISLQCYRAWQNTDRRYYMSASEALFDLHRQLMEADSDA